MTGSAATAFWARVDSTGGMDACWPWTGGRNDKGYGRVSAGHHQMVYVHRIALELALGRPIGAGLQALHRCDNPPCCNPLHLFEGTVADNMADKAAKGRATRGWLAPDVIDVIRTSDERPDVLAYRFGVSPRTIYRALKPRYRPAVAL